MLRLGVLGVRLNGLEGSRSVDEEDAIELPAPGLARPACSLCSDAQVSDMLLFMYFQHELTIRPSKHLGNQL